jgi:hypothetical protein
MQSQSVFDFFIVNGVGRRAVERLMRFTEERPGRVFKVKGDDRNEYTKVRGGKVHPVEYSAWQRFYSPLSAKGAQ